MKKWGTELKRTFRKELQMAKIHMKRMLTIPGHKGNTNQTHTKILLTPVRIASIRNTINNKCL
jgi:hypothetical protein